MSAESDMLKARAQLLMDQPFFGALALRLKLIQDNDNCDTAATDGVRLIYNSDYIEKLDTVTRKGLIAHEVMHCVFNHMTRRQERDPKLWNIATDFAINNHLIECDFVLPQGALVDDKYGDMTAEKIYANLDHENPPKQCPWGMVLDAGAGQLALHQSSDWFTLENPSTALSLENGEYTSAQASISTAKDVNVLLTNACVWNASKGCSSVGAGKPSLMTRICPAAPKYGSSLSTGKICSSPATILIS